MSGQLFFIVKININNTELHIVVPISIPVNRDIDKYFLTVINIKYNFLLIIFNWFILLLKFLKSFTSSAVLNINR